MNPTSLFFTKNMGTHTMRGHNKGRNPNGGGVDSSRRSTKVQSYPIVSINKESNERDQPDGELERGNLNFNPQSISNAGMS